MKKAAGAAFFAMRPRGFEPPPRNCRTRPSTWRVYQFRHRREWRSECSRARAYELALPPLRPAAAFCCFEPPPPPPEEPPPPEFLPPFLDAALPDPALAFEILAARSLDMPFLRMPSYCLSFFTEEP